ncbi:MAG: alpha/beta hydrolase [Pseudomonadota bacterium]
MDPSSIAIRNCQLELRRRGHGRPLVFLHGGQGIIGADAFLDACATHYDVLVPSHPGFGRSDWPDHIRSVSELALFYLDVFDTLDLTDIALVGSSFGGWVAAEIMVRNCHRIGHSVFLDTLGVKFGTREERDIADLHSLDDPSAAKLLYHDERFAPSDFSKASDNERTEVARNREAFTYFGWKPYMHAPYLKHWLHRIRVPSLVLWGAYDGVVSVSYGEQFANALPAAQFEVIDAAGHFPHIEQPLDTFALVHNFLSGQEAG